MQLSKPPSRGTQPVLNPVLKPEKQQYSCDELQQFIRFFPSHFTLGLPGSALRYRHILDEVILALHAVPAKYRIPQYNLLGFLYACQGNYNYAFRYFHEVSALQENNIISIANQAHCFLRQNFPEKAHECLQKLINLTSSADFLQITKESVYMSEAKTNLGYAYHVFGLNNAAKRMYESALKYNSSNLNANFGLAATLLTISYHENRSRRDFFLKVASNLMNIVLMTEPGFLPATIVILKIRAENKSFTSVQLDSQIALILRQNKNLLNAKIYRDLASIRMERKEFDDELGAIDLLQQSLELAPTAEAFHLLGKAHYLRWYKAQKKKRKYVKRSLTLAIKTAGMDLTKLPDLSEENENAQSLAEIAESAVSGPGVLTTNTMGETEMLMLVRSQFENAAKKCYNSNLETLLELGIVCGKLEEYQRARELLKRAITSEDISIQERGYRYLALFDQKADPQVTERYFQEVISRQHCVNLTDTERDEFWEKVFAHAEELLAEKGHQRAYPWIKDLVDAGFHRADLLVELHNRSAAHPMMGLNGEVPQGNIKKINSRKQSKSRMM
ncbi:hypothetical protein ACHWQZ_G007333 [Mnemiopsis leidyi]